MDRTTATLVRLRRLARSVDPTTKPVDDALAVVRELLEDAGVPFKIVGGIAVVHHGYLRTTEDIDVLVAPTGPGALDPLLEARAFVRETYRRLRHEPTGVTIDLLVAGEPMPRPAGPRYPEPAHVGSSDRDPAIIDLAGLLELKLHAARHQDLADVVELIKPLDDGPYLDLEARVDRTLRPRLAELRRDALEERGWER